MDISKTLDDACEALEANIQRCIRNKGNMAPCDVELLEHDLAALEAIKRLMDAHAEKDNGNSFMRGHSMNYSTGHHDAGNSTRYYDGNGYSGHSKADMIIYHAENLLDAAQTEADRQFLRDWIDRLKHPTRA